MILDQVDFAVFAVCVSRIIEICCACREFAVTGASRG